MRFPRLTGRRVPFRASRAGGQSLTELALILPILIIMLLAIVDFARLYTTMLTVEAAVREAADYGAFDTANWQTTPVDNSATTIAGMQQRACIASRNLPDYVGPDDACTNPAFAYVLTGTSCDDPATDPPCTVTVTLTYSFRLIAPLRLDFFGTQLGLPNTITFTRDSVFAVSSFQVAP